MKAPKQTADDVMIRIEWLECQVDGGVISSMAQGLLEHLTEVHRVRDKTMEQYIREALGTYGVETDNWGPSNRFCEMI